MLPLGPRHMSRTATTQAALCPTTTGVGTIATFQKALVTSAFGNMAELAQATVMGAKPNSRFWPKAAPQLLVSAWGEADIQRDWRKV